jgi:hypothetical protein
MPNHIEIIERLEEVTENFILEFESSIPSANEEILSELSDLVSQLKRRSTGGVISSVENLKIIDNYRKTLTKVVKGSKYGTAAK